VGLRNALRAPHLRAVWPFARASSVGADFVELVDELIANTQPTFAGRQTIAAYRESIAREIAAGSPATE
jgi:hypothetical protein